MLFVINYLHIPYMRRMYYDEILTVPNTQTLHISHTILSQLYWHSLSSLPSHADIYYIYIFLEWFTGFSSFSQSPPIFRFSVWTIIFSSHTSHLSTAQNHRQLIIYEKCMKRKWENWHLRAYKPHRQIHTYARTHARSTEIVFSQYTNRSMTIHLISINYTFYFNEPCISIAIALRLHSAYLVNVPKKIYI